MESNRDEADRCIELALAAINSSNYDKAEKFLRKADKLFPSQRVNDLLRHVGSMAGSANNKSPSHQSTENLRARKNAGTEQQEGTAKTAPHEQDYTKEQLDMVRKIQKCKDFYEVLSVTKEATDSEIKKAYKKLALQLHPDKNKAPGAAEAFKALGNAVAVLTDTRKRKEYDLYGSQVDEGHQQHFNHSRYHADHNNYEYAYARGFESDISAEELFNMFFGGFPQQRMNGGQRYASQQHRRESGQQPGIAFGLILCLVIISMMSSFFTSDPLYSLAHTSKYHIQRRTNHLNIPYYVKDSFTEDYQGSLARLENSVEEDYITTMKQSCYREKSYRDSMIARARSFGSRTQVEQAQSLKVPSCDNLARIGLTRYSFY